MPDQSPAEFGTSHPKESFWKKILKREKVNHPNNARPADKVLEEKPKVIPPDPLKYLEDWWRQNRPSYSHDQLFQPWGATTSFYSHDSNLPSHITDATHLTDTLRKEGLIPFSESAMILPLDAEKVEKALPPYLKLSPIDIDSSHRVYLVNPSSKILELTHYKEGKFLFRGEGAETLDKATELVIKRFEEGRMKSRGRSEVHTTPQALTAARAYAYGTGNYGLVWIIRREAMDNHPISIQNAGAEVLFPEISLKHIAGCIASSPEIEKAVQNKINLPQNFFYTIPPSSNFKNLSNLERLEQKDKSLMSYIKELEK